MTHTLYIDDAESNLFVLGMAMDTWGLTLDCASSGEQGLEKANTNAYGLILCDIRLPRMTGYDILRQIRNKPNPNQFVPIIAFTADVTVENKQSIIQAGFTDFVSKPFHMNLLQQIVLDYTTTTTEVPNFDHFIQSVPAAHEYSAVKEKLLADFQSFEKRISWAWQTGNMAEINHQLEQIELLCNQLKLQEMASHCSSIKAERSFNGQSEKSFRLLKSRMLGVSRALVV
jgi:CheY-like chemotaxis protein